MQGKKKIYVLVFLFMIVFSLCFFAKTAQAKTITYLDSVSQTPETTAYFKQFSSEEFVSLRMSNRVAMYDSQYNDDDFWEHGLVFYLNENEYGYFSVQDAVSVEMENIGITVDGKQLDGTLSFDVEGHGSTHTTDGLRAVFLVLNCKNPQVSWECTSISITQDGRSSGAECAQTSVYTKMYLYEHDSGQPYYGRLAFYVADLDVGHVPLPEQVRICNGFADDVYVANNTELDRNELVASGGTHFVATREYEPTSFLNGFVAYINNPWSDWWWSGTSCGTEFGSITETYPSSMVEDPRKSIDSIDGKAPTVEVPEAKRGNVVEYSFLQKFPFVITSNAPASITLSDTLDERYDLNSVACQVIKELSENGGSTFSDDTINWTIEIVGQTIFFSAKNPVTIGGTYRFIIHNSVLKAHCALGRLSNQIHSEVHPNNADQQVITKDSNVVWILVKSRYDTLEVTKTISADAFVKAHGTPTFFICLEGTKNEKAVKEYACITFDNLSEQDGTATKTVSFSLEGFDGWAAVYEMDSLRYRLKALTSSNKDVRIEDSRITIDLGGVQDGYTLEVSFLNKKIFQEKTSDTALVTNKILL